MEIWEVLVFVAGVLAAIYGIVAFPIFYRNLFDSRRNGRIERLIVEFSLRRRQGEDIHSQEIDWLTKSLSVAQYSGLPPDLQRLFTDTVLEQSAGAASNLSSKSDEAHKIDQAFQRTMARATELMMVGGISTTILKRIGDRELKHLRKKEPILIGRGELSRPPGNSAAHYVLYSEGPQLSMTKFAKTSTVHSHGAAAVTLIYRGRERYTTFRRTDDGETEGKATLEKVFDKVLGPGDIVYHLDSPEDIHRQEPVDGPVWELTFTASDPLTRQLEIYEGVTLDKKGPIECTLKLVDRVGRVS